MCGATHVDQVAVVAVAQVVEHRGFVEMRQLCHVLNLVKLGRIRPVQKGADSSTRERQSSKPHSHREARVRGEIAALDLALDARGKLDLGGGHM